MEEALWELPDGWWRLWLASFFLAETALAAMAVLAAMALIGNIPPLPPEPTSAWLSTFTP